MGWLKKAFKKVNNIARKIDPIGHKVVDKVVAQDSRNVRSLAKLFGGSADGKGWASSLYREADRNVQDPQWALAKAAIATATVYGGMAAYGAYAGAGAGAGGAGGSALGTGITGTGGASGMAAYGAAPAGSFLGTAGTGSLGAGAAGYGSTLAGSLGAYGGAGLYGAGGITSVPTTTQAGGLMQNAKDAYDIYNKGKKVYNAFQQITGGTGQGQPGMGMSGGIGDAGNPAGYNSMLDSAGGLGGRMGNAQRQQEEWLNTAYAPVQAEQDKWAMLRKVKDNPEEFQDDLDQV